MSESVTIIPYSDDMHRLSSHLDFDLWGLDEKDEEGLSKKSRGKYHVFVF